MDWCWAISRCGLMGRITLLALINLKSSLLDVASQSPHLEVYTSVKSDTSGRLQLQHKHKNWDIQYSRLLKMTGDENKCCMSSKNKSPSSLLDTSPKAPCRINYRRKISNTRQKNSSLGVSALSPLNHVYFTSKVQRVISLGLILYGCISCRLKNILLIYILMSSFCRLMFISQKKPTAWMHMILQTTEAKSGLRQ